MSEVVIPEITPEETPVVPEEGTIEAVEEELVLPSDAVEFEMPEKFAGKTAEEIAQSYLELEAMKNKAPEVEQAKDENEELTKVDASNTEDLIAEYAERGTELTEEDYQTLQEKGYSKRQVDIYAAGIKAEQQAESLQVLTDAGVTVDQVNESLEFARENWDEARIARTNEMLESSDRNVQIQALQLLQDAHSMSNPAQQETAIHSGTKVAAPSAGYESQEQMISDMRDPRYKPGFQQDKAYVAAVKAKVAKSTF